MSKKPFVHLVIYIIWEQILSQVLLKQNGYWHSRVDVYCVLVYTIMDSILVSISGVLTLHVDVTHARDHAERIEWFIEDQARMIRLVALPLLNLSRTVNKFSLFLGPPVCRGRGMGVEPNNTAARSLALHKSSTTLCMRPSHSCAWWPLTPKYHFNYPSGAFIKGTESRDLLSGMLRGWIRLKDGLKSGELETQEDIATRISCAWLGDTDQHSARLPFLFKKSPSLWLIKTGKGNISFQRKLQVLAPRPTSIRKFATFLTPPSVLIVFYV